MKSMSCLVKENKMSMMQYCDSRFHCVRNDGRTFDGIIVDVWSWPSTNPEKGELLIIKQDDGTIKSVYVKDLTSHNVVV